MPSLGWRVRSTFQIPALLFVCILAAQTSSAVGATTTYQFAGQCSDCSGTGVGLLTVQNYTQGAALGNANFVSFSYSSNLISYTITASNLVGLVGTLPTSLPAPATVTIAGPGNNVHISNSNGSWCSGVSCVSDYGSSSSWSLPSTSPTVVPVLSVPMLIGLAVMLALIGGILLKRLRKPGAA